MGPSRGDGAWRVRGKTPPRRDGVRDRWTRPVGWERGVPGGDRSELRDGQATSSQVPFYKGCKNIPGEQSERWYHVTAVSPHNPLRNLVKCKMVWLLFWTYNKSLVFNLNI